MVLNNRIKGEPLVRVGLLTGVRAAEISLQGGFVTSTGDPAPDGCYKVTCAEGAVIMAGRFKEQSLVLSPVDPARARFTVHGITIGIQFHWERQESQTFQGALVLAASREGINIINEIPIEPYLTSVISSEMSASSPDELLKAHAILSRSWLLYQLSGAASGTQAIPTAGKDDEIIRWYDRESHAEFDVCADDHCQRYQGTTKAHSNAAFEAVEHTRGQALVFGKQICDARYSKSCGGMTEAYSSAWQDLTIPYLQPVYDGVGEPEGFVFPLSDEGNARHWITSAPPAFCNVRSADLLARVLPGFDQETTDFYRWNVEYGADELSELLRSRLEIDFGRILDIDAILRGASGRIVRLRITGDKRSVTIGKELEIRKALSRSHLYSSAFVIGKELDPSTGKAVKFKLAGAGWGHGVGLCQIGAAAMADAGSNYRDILSHYFRGASIDRLY